MVIGKSVFGKLHYESLIRNHYLCHMNVAELLKRALNFEFLSIEEGVFLFENAATTELMFVANELRRK